jgi:polyribonucleotide nucleotidyltransferase
MVDVQLIEVDQKTGKLRLSRKPLIPKPEGYVEPPKREHSERRDYHGSRDGSRGGHDRDRGDRRSNDRRRDNNR